MLHASIHTHFHARVDMQQSWELQTWSVHMLHTFQDSSRMLLPHLRTRQAEGIVGSSVGWTWIQTPACCCFFCCFWLCQKHNGAERHNSLLFTAHSLTYTNINAPFCASCALVFLCGVAKVIIAYCLLSLPYCWIWRNVPHCGLRQGKWILLKLSTVFQLFLSHLHFPELSWSLLLVGFFLFLLKLPRRQSRGNC